VRGAFGGVGQGKNARSPISHDTKHGSSNGAATATGTGASSISQQKHHGAKLGNAFGSNSGA